MGTRARPRRPGPVAIAVGACGVIAVLVGGAALLTDRDEVPPSSSAAGARPSAATSPDVSTPPSAAPSAASTTPAQELSPTVLAATGPARTVTAARAALEEQLAARADAELALLRSTWAGDGAATGAAQAVAASTAGLSAVLTTWWDSTVASTISDGLDRQSEASRAYAASVAAGDLAASDRARAEMAAVSRELGGVLDGLTEGRIAAYVPPQDAAQYRAYVDALQAGDAAAADETAAWLRDRLTREGTALAASLSGGSAS